MIPDAGDTQLIHQFSDNSQADLMPFLNKNGPHLFDAGNLVILVINLFDCMAKLCPTNVEACRLPLIPVQMIVVH